MWRVKLENCEPLPPQQTHTPQLVAWRSQKQKSPSFTCSLLYGEGGRDGGRAGGITSMQLNEADRKCERQLFARQTWQNERKAVPKCMVPNTGTKRGTDRANEGV